MPSILRNIGNFVVSASVAYVLAVFFHTQMVFARMGSVGAEVDLQTRIATTIGNFQGLSLYAVVILIALALGFLVAAFLKRILKPLAPIAYPLAGAAAIAVALFGMSAAYYGTTPIAGARGALGFALQCLSGAAGGWVFARLTRSRS